jgi:hypothetical protein
MKDKTSKLRIATANNMYLLNNKTLINVAEDRYLLNMSRV